MCSQHADLPSEWKTSSLEDPLLTDSSVAARADDDEGSRPSVGIDTEAQAFALKIHLDLEMEVLTKCEVELTCATRGLLGRSFTLHFA